MRVYYKDLLSKEHRSGVNCKVKLNHGIINEKSSIRVRKVLIKMKPRALGPHGMPIEIRILIGEIWIDWPCKLFSDFIFQR